MSEIHFVLITPDAFKNAPPNSGMAYKWSVFTQWEREATDADDQAFEQSMALSASSGHDVFTNVEKFTFPKGMKINRMVGTFEYIPLLSEGRYELVVRWRSHGDESWTDGGRYPILVIYDAAPKLPPSPVTAPTS
jgi:hypothetical protein